MAAALAHALPRALPDAFVLYLSGELGAGKTTFARGFLQALNAPQPIRSPSYTLVETYELAGLTAVHLDLYRLSDASELEALGLRELAAPGYLWLIEWPERGAGRLPAPDLEIVLSVQAPGHTLAIEPRSSAGNALLRAAVASLPASS